VKEVEIVTLLHFTISAPENKIVNLGEHAETLLWAIHQQSEESELGPRMDREDEELEVAMIMSSEQHDAYLRLLGEHATQICLEIKRERREELAEEAKRLEWLWEEWQQRPHHLRGDSFDQLNKFQVLIL
jgi:hypothetical protein